MTSTGIVARDIDEIKAAVQRKQPGALWEIVSARYYWLHVVAFGVAGETAATAGQRPSPVPLGRCSGSLRRWWSVSIYAYRVRGVLQTVRDTTAAHPVVLLGTTPSESSCTL